MPSRAHTSIEVCRVVLFILLFVMPLAQSSHGEPCVHEAVAATFTRPECQTPELLSRGYRAIMGGESCQTSGASAWLVCAQRSAPVPSAAMWNSSAAQVRNKGGGPEFSPGPPPVRSWLCLPWEREAHPRSRRRHSGAKLTGQALESAHHRARPQEDPPTHRRRAEASGVERRDVR
jgi:hypothetical protein